YDENKSINEGAITIPGFSTEGWFGRILRGCGFFDPDKPIKKFTKKELHDLLYREPTRLKIDGVNLTYMGLIPQIQKSYLSKDVEAMQPHIRAFVERAVVFRQCPDCKGTRLNDAARSAKIAGKNIAELCAMQGSDLAEWVRKLKEPSVAPLLARLQHTLGPTSKSSSTPRSTGRLRQVGDRRRAPPRSDGARGLDPRSGPRSGPRRRTRRLPGHARTDGEGWLHPHGEASRRLRRRGHHQEE